MVVRLRFWMNRVRQTEGTDRLTLLDLHVQDFEEYLNLQSRTFVQYYRCLPLSLLKKENADEDGNRGKVASSALFLFFFFQIPFSEGCNVLTFCCCILICSYHAAVCP